MQLEAMGYQFVTLGYIDPHFKTDKFLVTPDGRTLASYDYLWQVPMQLNDGEEIVLPDTAVTAPARNTNSYVLLSESTAMGPQAVLLVIIAIAFVAGYLFYQALNTGGAGQPLAPPCGVRGSVIEISDCVKEIIYPDCSGVMYDSCQETIIDSFDPPEPPPWGWFEWAVVGAIGVGAIIVVYSIVKGSQKRHYAQAYPGRPPPPTLRGAMAGRLYGPRRNNRRNGV